MHGRIPRSRVGKSGCLPPLSAECSFCQDFGCRTRIRPRIVGRGGAKSHCSSTNTLKSPLPVLGGLLVERGWREQSRLEPFVRRVLSKLISSPIRTFVFPTRSTHAPPLGHSAVIFSPAVLHVSLLGAARQSVLRVDGLRRHHVCWSLLCRPIVSWVDRIVVAAPIQVCRGEPLG